MNASFRLTALAHGGGCGCKLAPSVLQQLLSKSSDHPIAGASTRLIVGNETGDDAAVWRLDDGTCVISTTDFFMPIVDDPTDFGRIAAANAISDIYAMGGTPIMALAILGAPVNQMPIEMVRAILEGGAAVCASAGIPVAGGHSIDSPEPIYGLAVTGLAKLEHIRRNNSAQPGDALILTKALGVGVYSAAFKKNALSDRDYSDLIATTTLLNSIGSIVAGDPAVHAMTDVTGFGLLGHAMEIARGSRLQLRVNLSEIPYLPRAEQFAIDGFVTGASARNWTSYGESVQGLDDRPLWLRQLLADPQTSGGLLISCDASSAERLLEQIRAAGYSSAEIIGDTRAGEPGILVE
jgi:selenide,water dikinase